MAASIFLSATSFAQHSSNTTYIWGGAYAKGTSFRLFLVGNNAIKDLWDKTLSQIAHHTPISKVSSGGVQIFAAEYCNSNTNVLGYHNHDNTLVVDTSFPNALKHTGGANAYINTCNTAWSSNSSTREIQYRHTMMHELGHVFGLEHVTDINEVMIPTGPRDYCTGAWGVGPFINNCPTYWLDFALTNWYLHGITNRSLSAGRAASSRTLAKNGKEVKPVMHFEKARSFTDTDQLLAEAELVVRGVVEQRFPSRPEPLLFKRDDGKFEAVGRQQWVRNSSVSVKEVLAGDSTSAGDTILIKQFSDEVKGRSIEANVVWLKKNQEVLLYLKKERDVFGDETGEYYIVGISDGLFVLNNGQIKTGFQLLAEKLPHDHDDEFNLEINTPVGYTNFVRQKARSLK